MFSVGDKIVCIDNSIDDRKKLYISPGNHCLTLGKIYTILVHQTSGVWIINDNGIFFYYGIKRFISLKEYRKNKLNKIYENR